MAVPVISVAQMREWEKATWASGQTEVEVIRRVGERLAKSALELSRPGDLILVVAGKGNNGADAKAAQEHLKQRRVDLLEVRDPAQDLSKLSELLSLRPALVVDALFGIGLNRPLSDEWSAFIEAINRANLKVLAVDVPSGLNAETGEPSNVAVRAAVTLTVGAPKLGMLRASAWPYVGRLEVADEVGLIPCNQTSELSWVLPEDFERFPPARAVASHKGTYGHLGIVAGSLGYHGASVLAARGAQRARPGLITLHTMAAVYGPVASQLQAVMVSPWRPDEHFEERYSGIVIGPGLASEDVPEEVKTATRRLWQEAKIAVVVDASALAWVPEGNRRDVSARRVITPHPGEAARMLGISSKEVQEDRVKAVRDLSRRFGDTWVVLKGHETLVARSEGEISVNSSGNSHLAQGGSGDVLSGYLGGLLCQPELQKDIFKTIRYAIWQHGAAADYLQKMKPNWVIEDLVQDLGGNYARF
jgi:NAD(P)H-hydrate epimerase